MERFIFSSQTHNEEKNKKKLFRYFVDQQLLLYVRKKTNWKESEQKD